MSAKAAEDTMDRMIGVLQGTGASNETVGLALRWNLRRDPDLHTLEVDFSMIHRVGVIPRLAGAFCRVMLVRVVSGHAARLSRGVLPPTVGAKCDSVIEGLKKKMAMGSRSIRRYLTITAVLNACARTNASTPHEGYVC